MPKRISKRDADVKRMAELLRAGATMMAEACPDCKVPIFKLTNGEMICPSCGRRVVFAKSSEAEKLAAQTSAASELEDLLQRKILSIKERIEGTDEPSELESLSKSLSSLLDSLEKVRQGKG
jgi:UPF0148 protein